MILIAFDFGTKNIGVAIGQRVTGTAWPLSSLKVKRNGLPNWEKIELLLEEWKPEHVIVGLPLNMDGTSQLLTAKAYWFAEHLYGRFSIKVDLHDERLSTKEARANLFARGGYKTLTKSNIDSLSAAIILESWFENFLV